VTIYAPEQRPQFGKWITTSAKLQKEGLATDIDSPTHAANDERSTIFEEESKLQFSANADFSKS
jgi:hypothetical protein